jgi:sec-independent protein translocase protein TatA
MFGLGGQEILLLIILGILLFGKRLPEVGRSLGKTATEFRKGLKGLEDEVHVPAVYAARASVEPQSLRAPQRVAPPTQRFTFDDAPSQPTIPPRV